VEEIGLGDLLSHKNLDPNHDPISIYTVLSEVKAEVEEWKRECRRLEEELQNGQDEMERQG